MRPLKEIKDQPLPKDKKVETRSACRAVLFDSDNLIPILFVSKFNYHKIPGGGIEKGETKEEATTRELLEETGCTAQITDEIGEIVEYRSRWNLLQTSHCHLGRVVSKGPQSFTKKEKNQGFELVWLPLDEAIEIFKKDKPGNYEGKFIRERDLAFLEEVKKIQG